MTIVCRAAAGVPSSGGAASAGAGVGGGAGAGVIAVSWVGATAGTSMVTRVLSVVVVVETRGVAARGSSPNMSVVVCVLAWI
jgi:hypothetical protein